MGRINFYSVGNGWIKINGKPIKLTPSTNPRMPASQGYVWFRWGKFTIYLRFFHGRFLVFQFGPGCKRTFHHVKGLCASGKGTKGPKPKKCSRPCHRALRPVCDNHGRTHANGCTFKIAKCKNPKLKYAHRGRCKSKPKPKPKPGPKPKKCSRPCHRAFKPVCDNHGRTHANGCTFKIAKCRNPKLKY